MSSSLTEPLISPQQQEQNNDSPIATSAPPKSKNINIILTYTFFTFSARSLWNQSVLSAFVYLLKSNDPKYVGLLTAIMGIAQLLISFPSGVLADRYRRDTMLQIGSVIGVIAATSTYIATKAMSFAMLGMALFIWGLFWGITNTSVSALFADSILDGDRSNYFTQRMVVQVLGNTCGPLGALIMFFKLGDDWTTEECAVVICAGQCLAVPALVLLCFMNDDYCISSIGDDDDDDDVDDDGDSDDEEDHSCEAQETSGDDDLEEALIQEESNSTQNATQDDDHEHQQQDFLGIPSARVVPALVVSADIMSGLAAGMSIRYFPIFFLDNLNLSPANVQIVFIACMTFMAVIGKLVQWVGTKIGRVQTTLVCKWTGACLLLSMIHAYNSGMSALTVCTLYVFRTGLMNAPSALTKSVLMDHVPKEERAKWSALESVNMFSWSGSAVVGGFLVDAEGILFNFSVTTALQLLATIPLVLVFRRVQSEN